MRIKTVLMGKIRFRSFEDILNALEVIEQNDFVLKGDWDASQHLAHCAQAIEYSLQGYPQLRPSLMRETIGRIVFHVFAAKGNMSHNTNALTPGAPPITSIGLEDGVAMMRRNVLRFMDWQGPLQPHEFYGRLSKKGHIRAHSMHFANHFENFLIG